MAVPDFSYYHYKRTVIELRRSPQMPWNTQKNRFEVPLSFQLPADLPPSCRVSVRVVESSKGKIKYRLSASLTTPNKRYKSPRNAVKVYANPRPIEWIPSKRISGYANNKAFVVAQANASKLSPGQQATLDLTLKNVG